MPARRHPYPNYQPLSGERGAATTVHRTFKIGADLNEVLRKLAADAGLPVNAYLRHLIAEAAKRTVGHVDA